MEHKRVRIVNFDGAGLGWWYNKGTVKIGDEFDVYVDHPVSNDLRLYPSPHNDKMYERMLGLPFHKGRGGGHNFRSCYLLEQNVVDATLPATNREASRSLLLEQENR